MTYVKWNDPNVGWNTNPYQWDKAIVDQVVATFFPDWGLRHPKKEFEKRLPEDLAEKFFNVVINVNGLTYKFKGSKQVKPRITVDHIQKTFKEFGYDKQVSVKAEVKK